jgi:Tfp pilus assembly protein PilO
MSKNNKIILIILVSLIVLGLGYWFIYRPYAIKKSCFRQASEYYQQQQKKGQPESIEAFNLDYSLCLKKKAL